MRFLKAHENKITLAVHAQPNASKTAIRGEYGDALKVALHAQPSDGAANEELCEFLAIFFALPKRSVEILRGHTSREKVVVLTGLTMATAEEKLKQVLS